MSRDGKVCRLSNCKSPPRGWGAEVGRGAPCEHGLVWLRAQGRSGPEMSTRVALASARAADQRGQTEEQEPAVAPTPGARLLPTGKPCHSSRCHEDPEAATKKTPQNLQVVLRVRCVLAAPHSLRRG